MIRKGCADKIFILVLLAGLFAYTPPVYSEHLSASGCSVSIVGYLSDLAKEYEKQTGVKMLVRGGGSVVGLEDLSSGKIDFAASCKARTAGDPRDVRYIQVAWDVLVFIVHRSNPLEDISIKDVRAIYEGKITGWKNLNGDDAKIKLFVSRSPKGRSGVEMSIRDIILNGKEPAKTAGTVFLASTALVEQMVEGTDNGFGATGFSSGRKRNVKMLKVDGVMPTKKNIIANKYRLRRPLFIVVSKNPRPAVTRFVDFVLSHKGQKLISSYGVVSLLDITDVVQ